MKKTSILAVALAAMVFAACGGNKPAQTAEEAEAPKSFEQEQLEASIKQNFDSLAAELSKFKQLPIRKQDGIITLTEEEIKVKPDFLLDAKVAEQAASLAEKYRVLSALQVDKEIAYLYEMPIKNYDDEITKLIIDINDPSFKEVKSNEIFEATHQLYEAMSKNNRINYYWQIVSTALVEQLYVVSQNTDRFITAFDDEKASNISYRIALIQDAINRLADYDPEIVPVKDAFEPLTVINAMNVDELKVQLEEAKEEITEARNCLVG